MKKPKTLEYAEAKSAELRKRLDELHIELSVSEAARMFLYRRYVLYILSYRGVKLGETVCMVESSCLGLIGSDNNLHYIYQGISKKERALIIGVGESGHIEVRKCTTRGKPYKFSYFVSLDHLLEWM